MVQQLPVGQGHLIIEDSCSHSVKHTTLSMTTPQNVYFTVLIFKLFLLLYAIEQASF